MNLNASIVDQRVIGFQSEIFELASTDGKEILRKWRENGYKREALDELVGKYCDHTDMRGAPLNGVDLSKQDLSKIDFFRADLSNSNLSASNLDDTWLSESNLRGTSFDWCRMNGTLLDNVQYDTKTSFLGVDLNSINFTLAVLLHEQAHFQQRIEHLKRRHPTMSWWLWLTSNYGQSLSRWMAWVVGVITTFGVIFSAVPETIVSNTGSAPTLLDGVYFSTVTFTTIGYGDWVPRSALGKLLVMLEAFIGYLMGGLLVAILAKRVLG